MSVSPISGPHTRPPVSALTAVSPPTARSTTLKAGDHIELSHPQQGFGVGVMAGASAEAGVGAGLGATASAGAGVFYDGNRDVRPGVFAAAGAFAGGGHQDRHIAPAPGSAGALGAFAGAGVGAFVTNASSAKQLDGVAETYSLNVGVGPLKVSLQVGAAHGTYVGSVSIGPGIGIDVSQYPTHSISSRQ